MALITKEIVILVSQLLSIETIFVGCGEKRCPKVYQKVSTLCLCVSATRPESLVPPRHLRGVWLCVALQEEAHALLVWPVGIEARHHHYLPWQVADEAGRAEHRLTQAAEALHYEAESRLWPPTGVCGKTPCGGGKRVGRSDSKQTSSSLKEQVLLVNGYKLIQDQRPRCQ